jgi:hypothetical protein
MSQLVGVFLQSRYKLEDGGGMQRNCWETALISLNGLNEFLKRRISLKPSFTKIINLKRCFFST